MSTKIYAICVNWTTDCTFCVKVTYYFSHVFIPNITCKLIMNYNLTFW